MLSSWHSKAVAGSRRASVSPADRRQQPKPPARGANSRIQCRSARAAGAFFPDPLQRPCHQTVLGFDGIILTACPLRLIARSLALERPLPLQPSGLASSSPRAAIASARRPVSALRVTIFPPPHRRPRRAPPDIAARHVDAGRRDKDRQDSCRSGRNNAAPCGGRTGHK